MEKTIRGSSGYFEKADLWYRNLFAEDMINLLIDAY